MPSLELDGYSNVAFMTLRPGHDLLAHKVERITHTVRAGGLICVVDDPPRTGLQLAAAAEQLLSIGVSAQSLVRRSSLLLTVGLCFARVLSEREVHVVVTDTDSEISFGAIC